MNSIAIIFQRSSIGTLLEREKEAARLTSYAEQNKLTIASVYVASGEPNMLTIEMLISGCMAREKPGHVIMTRLSRLWMGEDVGRIIAMVETAGAIVHVVPPEAP